MAPLNIVRRTFRTKGMHSNWNHTWLCQMMARTFLYVTWIVPTCNSTNFLSQKPPMFYVLHLEARKKNHFRCCHWKHIASTKKTSLSLSPRLLRERTVAPYNSPLAALFKHARTHKSAAPMPAARWAMSPQSHNHQARGSIGPALSGPRAA